MQGMSATTGETLSGVAHLRQSVQDILTTPVGSRVMRRDYGSRVPDLIDAPANATTIQKVRAAIADALIRWEPRLRIHRILAFDIESAAGKISIDIEGEYLPDGLPERPEKIMLEGITV